MKISLEMNNCGQVWILEGAESKPTDVELRDLTGIKGSQIRIYKNT